MEFSDVALLLEATLEAAAGKRPFTRRGPYVRVPYVFLEEGEICLHPHIGDDGTPGKPFDMVLSVLDQRVTRRISTAEEAKAAFHELMGLAQDLMDRKLQQAVGERLERFHNVYRVFWQNSAQSPAQWTSESLHGGPLYTLRNLFGLLSKLGVSVSDEILQSIARAHPGEEVGFQTPEKSRFYIYPLRPGSRSAGW